jgi:predicted metal-dependent phosphotriesterase family hydrolase
MSQRLMTVRGPVDPTELGFGLTHEHLRIDLISVFTASMLAFDFHPRGPQAWLPVATAAVP